LSVVSGIVSAMSTTPRRPEAADLARYLLERARAGGVVRIRPGGCWLSALDENAAL
jgi:hypothetical protein